MPLIDIGDIKIVNWLRWIAVLPASLLAAVLSSFPLHFVLYMILTGSGLMDFYPETPERVLLPLAATIASIWTGTKVAPNHKVRTATVLFGVWILPLCILITVVLTGAYLGSLQFHFEGGGLAPIMALIGAITGLYIVRKQNSTKMADVNK